MSIKAVLFDLDGTLLPMDQEAFNAAYFSELAKKFAPLGYEPKAFIDGVGAGVKAMIKNSGTYTNEIVFWATFAELIGERVLAEKEIFEGFYENEYSNVRSSCGYNPESAKILNQFKEKGLKLVLATNPVFPDIAVRKRMAWAGVEPEIFELYTTFENSSYCKPNPKYYTEILNKLGLNPEECLMVGNDVSEDMVARKAGLNVFLLTDCIINNTNEDISHYPHGGFTELLVHIESLK